MSLLRAAGRLWDANGQLVEFVGADPHALDNVLRLLCDSLRLFGLAVVIHSGSQEHPAAKGLFALATRVSDSRTVNRVCLTNEILHAIVSGLRARKREASETKGAPVKKRRAPPPPPKYLDPLRLLQGLCMLFFGPCELLAFGSYHAPTLIKLDSPYWLKKAIQLWLLYSLTELAIDAGYLHMLYPKKRELERKYAKNPTRDLHADLIQIDERIKDLLLSSAVAIFNTPIALHSSQSTPLVHPGMLLVYSFLASCTSIYRNWMRHFGPARGAEGSRSF